MKFNKKEKYDNMPNINLENRKKVNNNKMYKKSKFDEKKEKTQISKRYKKKMMRMKKKIRNKTYIRKKFNILFENYYIDDSIEKKNQLNNLKIQRRYKKKSKDKCNKIYIIYLYFFIISKIFFSQFIKCYNRKIELATSYINLKINGTGNMKIYSENYLSEKPDIIIIINNNINYTKTNIVNTYYFNSSENYINDIKLIWDKPINSTINMFKNCYNIIEIDLSSFDTTSVTTMESMFTGCSLLTSINLSNFETFSVTKMNGMFSGCSLIESLDLSSFDSASVTTMEGMFSGCSSLKSLDLSNFNTPSLITVGGMFYGCLSLTSLDLSNFITSQLTIMDCIFETLFNFFSELWSYHIWYFFIINQKLFLSRITLNIFNDIYKNKYKII